MATERFRSEQSEESALSRLPVVYAAIRMFRAKPLLGWGYENFDRFDRDFQSRVGNLVTPEKDHASHNLYLTLLAEQGAVGFVLFLGPAFYWLFRSWAYRRRADRSGLVGGNLVGVLWLVLVAVVVVSNFHRMQVPFGFGIWWLSLGLIASVVGRRRPEPASLPADRSRADGAFMATLPADLRPGLRVGRLPAPAGNGAPWHARGPRQNGSGRPRPSAGRGRVGRVAAVLLVPALATLMVALSITVSITRSPPRAEPAPPRTAEPDGATVSRGDPEGHPGPRDAGPPMGMIRVPDVTGGTSLHAHRRLVGAGLRLQRSIPVQGPSGIVIGTGPSPGDAVPRGTAVMIFVGTPSARAQWPVIAERDAEPTGGRV
jgi:hypothetical protein